MSFNSSPDESIILCLVVNAALRAEIAALLENTGLGLRFAGTSDVFLRQAEELLPTVMVLDIDPTVDSFETCRRLRASRLLGNVPILMLSSRQNRDERAAGLSAGADDFLEKPLDGLELLARLRALTRLNPQRLLLANLSRFTWMADHAQEGYLLLDRAGSILYANERTLELLNLDEEYLGLPFVSAVERLYLPEPVHVWEHWLEEPEPCFLVQPETPTARAAWLILEAHEIQVGTEYQRIARLRDVTERMAIYQDMRRFHTVVAHKLRTPLSILISHLTIIKNKMDMLTPDEIREYARGAIGGAERLAGEIRKILTYIDAPLALNLGQPAPLSLVPAMLAEICRLLGVEQVTLSLPDHLQQKTIALTPDALEMILHELLENARKFHPQHNPNVDISIGQTLAGFVDIRVADDGINLTPEQMRWAWLPYVQGEKDFTGELPGMGLGFPMVATLVWKAGGSLRLRNRPDGPGIVVEMKIPLEETIRQVERIAAPYRAE
ncbi:MAG: response regulator [Anaerolineales bacterium]|nr:response regulator [Anaerolineales bacterium]MDW8277135.1 response regulator [Anaerolineales bacterium]